MYMYKHGFFAHAGSEGTIQEWEEKEDVCYYWTISSDGGPRQCALHVKLDLSMCGEALIKGNYLLHQRQASVYSDVLG